LSVIAFAVPTVLAVGLLAAGGLWALRLAYRRSVRESAARSVLEQGSLIVRQLAGEVAGLGSDSGPEEQERFSRLFRSLCDLEPGLQYVSVSVPEEGTVLFSRQREALDGGGTVPVARPEGPVRRRPRLLSVGEQVIPVVTFSVRVRPDSGVERSVQIAMRGDAVGRKEAAPSRALEVMFQTALATMGGSLVLTLLIIVWLLRREISRQQQRVREEHLTFAGALADGIIHDVRNPMSALHLDVQMLHQEAKRGEAARMGRIAVMADRADRAIERIDAVFKEFLYVSRPSTEAGERFDLNGCLRDCLELMAPRFERSGVKTELRLADGTLPIRGYAPELKRALVNILTNATEASPEGGTVTVVSRRCGDRIEAEVLDEGPGIPAGLRLRLFEMFFSTRPGGTGLGLGLARTAVENNGGRLTAGNREGGGACFTISLPLAEKADAGASPGAGADGADAEGRGDGKP
jgi:signal transduction histidine kinase